MTGSRRGKQETLLATRIRVSKPIFRYESLDAPPLSPLRPLFFLNATMTPGRRGRQRRLRNCNGYRSRRTEMTIINEMATRISFYINAHKFA
ncbi:hypothetical protein B296_00032351 [Ensete ventricosum]|uniref:Uncharacterized protein n=1 Tax=Ensete ventricosum TaxID=4639 RepID=A0A426Z7H0_ENSVE|nr:hypothetical protein B296_00032351 [Ensete ventricosum]